MDRYERVKKLYDEVHVDTALTGKEAARQRREFLVRLDVLCTKDEGGKD